MISWITRQVVQHIVNCFEIIVVTTNVEQRLALHVWQERNFKLHITSVVIIRMNFIKNAFENCALLRKFVHDCLAAWQNSMTQSFDIRVINILQGHVARLQFFNDFPVKESE